MEFLKPLADAKNFPQARIFALASEIEQVDGVNHSQRYLPKGTECLALVDHARTALYLIASTMDTTCVWLPSYHCPALVEPFLAAGNNVKFYPVDADLSPDFSFLTKHIRSGDSLVAIRYFGFDCQIEYIADFCKKLQVTLIEDLAHAAHFKELYGDIAVTSLVKFYPVSQGGELIVPLNSLWKTSLLTALKPMASSQKIIWQTFLGKLLCKLFLKTPENNMYRYFNKKKISKNIAGKMKVIIESTDVDELMEARKNNYRYLVTSLSNCSLGHVLMPELADHITPYVVPFLLKEEQSFNYIRQHQIQVYRWDEMVKTECEYSKKYRSNLIQLPCHQDLSQQDLDYMISVFMENLDESR